MVSHRRGDQQYSGQPRTRPVRYVRLRPLRKVLWLSAFALLLSCCSFGESSNDGPEFTFVPFDCAQHVGFAAYLHDNLYPSEVGREELQQSWYDAMYQCEHLINFAAASSMMGNPDFAFWATENVCTEWFPGDTDPYVSGMCDDYARLCDVPGEREITQTCHEHFGSGEALVIHADHLQSYRRFYRLRDELGLSERGRLPSSD